MSARRDPIAAEPPLTTLRQRTSSADVSRLDPGLMELVAIRASQGNGCAGCVNRHAGCPRKNGEPGEPLDLPSTGSAAPCRSRRERAALGWTDALTRPCSESAHERAHEALKEQFTEQERVRLTLAIVIINDWNRGAEGCHDFADPVAIGPQVESTAVQR